MKRLQPEKVRRTLYEWHGNDSLYAAASSGLVGNIEQLQADLRRNAAWCDANPRAQRDCAHDARYLRDIADWLPDACARGGKVSRMEGWFHCLPWAIV